MSVNYPCLMPDEAGQAQARACNSTTRSTTAARLLRFCLTGLWEQSIISFTVDVYGSGTVIITSVTACSTAKFMPLSAAVSLCRIPTDRTTLTGVLRVCRKDF